MSVEDNFSERELLGPDLQSEDAGVTCLLNYDAHRLRTDSSSFLFNDAVLHLPQP
jgi:hypothetical protein